MTDNEALTPIMTRGPVDPAHFIPSSLQVGDRPDGVCVECRGRWSEVTVWVAIGDRGWAHVYAKHCGA